jgi:hypothetical protein
VDELILTRTSVWGHTSSPEETPGQLRHALSFFILLDSELDALFAWRASPSRDLSQGRSRGLTCDSDLPLAEALCHLSSVDGGHAGDRRIRPFGVEIATRVVSVGVDAPSGIVVGV